MVADLYVRAAYRRRGIARRMLRRLTTCRPEPSSWPSEEGTSSSEGGCPWGSGHRWGKVQLHVVKGNEAALQLYRSEGFTEARARRLG